ncbi:hypothetical protein ATCC90586_006195 [Pythium insidiosum]|nr:hypothetical protein ATCC90586_006195 [Pythium insidiosum]
MVAAVSSAGGLSQSDLAMRRPLHALVTWFLVYFIHALCAIYFLAAGMLYSFLPSTYLVYYFESNALTVPTRFFHRIAAGHFIIAALHVLGLLFPVFQAAAPTSKNLYHSLRRTVCVCDRGRVAPEGFESFRRSLTSFKTATQRALWAPRAVHRVLFSRHGLFGVESRHFEVIFLSREVIETLLQTYQAYRMSCKLPRVWLNRSFVALLVLNAWTTPLLHMILPHNMVLQRMLCILADILLDFASTVGVSTFLALPYVRIYDPALHSFPNLLIYTDRWLIQWINETQIVLFSSWSDAGSRLIFSLSLLGCLQDVKDLLETKRATASKDVAVVPQHRTSVASSFHQSKRKGCRRLIYFMMMAHGCVVLAAHLHAELKPRPPSCVLELRPWFVKRPGCSFVELSCHPKNPDRLKLGRADEITAVLREIDRTGLEHFTLRHCQAVEMPPLLQTLPWLIGAKIYNSSIVSWPFDAAFDADRHRHLRLFYGIRVTLPNETLPDGLMSPRFPPLLLDIELVFTNLARLPDHLDAIWPTAMTLYFEFGRLDHVPPVLYRLQPYMLVLSGNPLPAVPAELIMLRGLDTLVVRHLNTSGLPSDGVNATENTLTWFFFDYSDVPVFPDWMDAAFISTRLVSGGCTPACERLLADGVPADRPWLAGIDCVTCGLDTTVFYPVAVDERAEEEDSAW